MSRGLGSGLNISSIKATARLPTRRCILSLELGCNPVVPLLGFHEALAGPADGMCKPTALHATNGPNGSGSTPFFRTHPPTAAQNYQRKGLSEFV
jgi:hypothetical protein